MYRKKLSILVLALAAGMASAQKLEPPVRFAVIGDRTGSHVPGIYEQIVAEVERLKPDFAITVGDEIEGYSADTLILNQEWAEYRKIVAGLSMPLYIIPSNHNVTYDAGAPVFEHQVGKLNRSFDYRGLHFVILDVSRWESSAELPKEYIAWLIDDLKKNRNAKYIFVFFHKPFWYNTLADGKSDTLHTIFRNFGVDAVFNGHFHYYFSGKYDSILYTAIGSSAGGADSGPTGIMYHYAWVTVDNNGIHIAPIKINSVLAWDDVTAADMKMVDRISLSGISFPTRLMLNDRLLLEDSSFSVLVKNPCTSQAADDTLHWTCPQGWTVEPASQPVKAEPGDSIRLSFKARYKGAQPYPAPTLAVRLPYAKGKSSKTSAVLPVIRSISAIPGTVVIDGSVNEPVWQNPTCRLFAPEGGAANVESTAFSFAYDQDNLYLAAWCRESKMDSMVAKSDKQDSPVHTEDCVGFFLQPDDSRNQAYQIYFNPLGTVLDQKITNDSLTGVNADPKWNGEYEVKTAKGVDYWSLEARIPLAQFGVKAQPGRKMGLEIRRKQQHRKAVADWQVPLSYDLKGFGVLILKQAQPRVPNRAYQLSCSAVFMFDFTLHQALLSTRTLPFDS